MAITKTELVASIASATGESQATVGRVVDGLFSAVSEAVAKGEKVTIPASSRSSRSPRPLAPAATRRPARRSRSPRASASR